MTRSEMVVKDGPCRDAIRRSLPGCPRCGALQGDPCRTPQWKTTQPHKVRLLLKGAVTDTAKLKPCPFCGGEAERLYAGEIRCKCAAMMTHDGTYPCPAHGSKARFAWMWNRRAADSAWAAVEEIEKEMRAEIAEINADERFHYKTATVVENAPLALIQLVMETRDRVLRKYADRLAAARKGAKK